MNGPVAAWKNSGRKPGRGDGNRDAIGVSVLELNFFSVGKNELPLDHASARHFSLAFALDNLRAHDEAQVRIFEPVQIRHFSASMRHRGRKPGRDWFICS